jgi:hypothetical protein
MKNRAPLSISIALACCAFPFPGIATAQATQGAQAFANNNDIDSNAAQSVATQMVPAEVQLEKELDSRKMQPGQEFRATLSSTVHLKNGTELPRGTAWSELSVETTCRRADSPASRCALPGPRLKAAAKLFPLRQPSLVLRLRKIHTACTKVPAIRPPNPGTAALCRSMLLEPSPVLTCTAESQARIRAYLSQPRTI